jgi:hypothetical protein
LISLEIFTPFVLVVVFTFLDTLQLVMLPPVVHNVIATDSSFDRESEGSPVI